jgi:hypothetical protein
VSHATAIGGTDWEWPDDLDAVAAAPAHHGVLFENEYVRVLEARVEAGEAVPLHTHRLPGVQYFLSLADFVRCDANGEVVFDSRLDKLPNERPLVLWSEPTPPHTLENVGEVPIHVIVVESKPPLNRRD